MPANDSTPSEGESPDGESDPERAAALLLSRELSRIKAGAIEDLERAATAAWSGQLTGEHVRALRTLRDDLEDVTEAAAALAPDEYSQAQAREHGGVVVETVVRRVDD